MLTLTVETVLVILHCTLLLSKYGIMICLSNPQLSTIHIMHACTFKGGTDLFSCMHICRWQQWRVVEYLVKHSCVNLDCGGQYDGQTLLQQACW